MDRLSKLIQLSAAILVLLITIQFVLAAKRAYLTPLRKLPGPWHARWTTIWLKWKIISGQRAHYIDELHKIHGPYVRIAPNEISLSKVADHITIHGVGSKFYKSPWYETFTMSDGPHDLPGIFAMTDPKVHSERRKLFSHPFSNTSVMAKETIIREKIDMAVDKFARDARMQGHADLMKWWTFMATDVIAALSFGQSFELLEQEKKNQYINDLETTMKVTGIGGEFPILFKLIRSIPIKVLQDKLNTRARIDGYGLTAIQRHKEAIRKNPEASTSLFSRFLDSTRHKSEITEYQLAQEAGNLIVAGSDTTAIGLTYLTWSLLRPCNKHAYDKVMTEISCLPINAPAKDIVVLPYLKKVIEESLRLHAGTSSLPRAVPPGGASFGEYFLPAGTTVATQTYTLMRDQDTFTDPESFIPERWDSPTQKMKDAYSPFLTGPRTCLGIHLAILEITLGIFTFLKKCPSAQIAPSMRDEDMEFETYFLMAPKGHKLDLTLDM